MQCFYCKETIKDDAVVCRYCGAYAAETRKGMVWYPASDADDFSRRRLFWWVIVIVVVVALAVGVVRSIASSQKSADSYSKCIAAGRSDC